MATEVEERIVAAKFDSSQFEKGVDKTVKKLDELKESLDFKKTGESLEKLGKKTTEATESASKSLEKLSDRFTTFTGMLKQKFLSGLADRVVNTFFQMEHAITGFVRSMSVGQMGSGMQKFESILTSVRMITNATYDEIDKITGKKTGKKINYTEDSAYAVMEQLRTYTDETSYSMDQMTDAMSKMVAAGVGLDQATKNVQGIANAAAAAGVNATDAARAFFNLSQAYSSGSLKYIDYSSLQRLNMTNQNFEEQLLAAGVAAGTLKESKDAKGNKIYKTVKSKTNKKVTAGKIVTREGLAESLKYGWAGKDVMDELFGQRFYVDVEDFYAAQKAAKDTEGRIKYLTSIVDESKVTDKEMDKIMKSLDETDERRKEYFSITDSDKRKEYIKSLVKEEDIMAKLPKKYSEVAAKAFLAAREARNFNDVIRAVQEYVSSKWSKIFEHLFGRLEQASQFFTDLAEGGIADVFMKPMDWLSDLTEAWDAGGRGGDAFRDTILSIDKALGELFGAIGDIFPNAKSLGTLLIDVSQDISVAFQHLAEYARQFRIWFSQRAMSDGATRADHLRDAFANLSGIFIVFGRTVKLVFTAFRKTLSAFSPLFDALVLGFNEFVKPIGQLGSKGFTEPFDRLYYALESVFSVLDPLMEKIRPFIEGIGSLLGKIGGFILQMSVDTLIMNIEFIADAISLLFEVLSGTAGEKLEKREGVIGSIAKDIDDIGAACASAINTVKEFFGVLIKDIRTLLGLPAEEGQAAGEANQEGGLFAGIRNFFETNEFIQQAQAWVEQAKNDIIKWFSDLPQTISNFINGLLYKEETTVYQTGGYAPEIVKKQVETPLKQWLDTAVDTVAKFIADIPAKLLEGIGTIGNFVSMVINAIFGSKDGTEAKKDADTKKQEDQTTNAVKEWADKFSERFQKEIKMLPMRIRMYIRIYSRKMKATWKNLKTWFNNDETIATIKEWGASIFNTIKDFILKLPEHITNLVKTVGAAGRTIIGAIKELFKSDDVSKETQKELENGFNGISLQGVLDAIVNIGKEIANQFLSWFTGSEDIETNFNWLKEEVSKLIWSIPDGIRAAGSWAIIQLGNIWDNLYKALIGKKDKDGHDVSDIGSRVKFYLDGMKDKDGTISGGISNIVNIVSAAIDDAIAVISNLWGKLLSAISGSKKPLTKEMQQTLKQLEFNDPKRANELKKEWANFGFDIPGIKSGFEEFVGELGKAIVDVFSKIPGWITEGLNVAVTGINIALEWLTNNLSANIGKSEEEVAENVDKDNPAASGLEASFTKLGTNISNLIFKTIPGAISAGFERVKNDAINVWWPSLLSIFDGINNNSELQEQFSNVGANIVAWIDALPKRIKEAFYTLKLKIDSFFHPDAMIGDPRFIGKEAKEALDKAGKETKDDAEQSTLWDTIKSIVANIGDAFKRAFDALWPDVSSWFANLPTHIVEGLTIGINTIGDAFDGIGTFFDQLVNSKDAEEMATKAMEDAQKATEEGVEKGADNKDQQSSFVTAITGLGSAIWKVITESIPKAITGAFNWVRDNWDSWIDSLRGIFSAVTGTDIGEIDIKTITDSIMVAIKSLPEKISSAWSTVREQIAKIFKGNDKGILTKEDYAKLVSVPKKETKDIPTLLPDFLPKPKDFAKDVKNQLDETGTEVSKSSGESSFFDTIWSIGQDIGTVIQSAIDFVIENMGPTLLNGWNKSLEFITHLFEGLGGWFSGAFSDAGTALTTAFNDPKYSGLKEGITSLGENIETFLGSTIPEFIGSALAKIILAFPDLIKKVFAAFDKTWNAELQSEQKPDANKAEGVLDNLGELWKKISSFINNLVNVIIDDNGHLTNTAVIIGAIALVGVVASAIGNLFDSIRGVDGAAVAKNSLEGVLRSLINMMTVWLLVAAYAAKLNDTEYTRVIDLLNRMETLVNRVLEFYAIVKGAEYLKDGIGGLFNLLLVGKDKNSLNNDGAMDAIQNTSKKVGAVQTLIGGVVDGLATGGKIALGGTGAAVAVDAVGTAVNSIFSQFLGNFDMMGELIKGFNEKLDMTLEGINETKKKVLAAIDVLGNVSDLINLIIDIGTKKNRVMLGTNTIREINGPLAFLANTFKGEFHAKEMVQSLKDIIGMKSDMVEFVKFMNEDDTFAQFRYGLMSLGNVLSFFDLTNLAGAKSISDEQIIAAVDVIEKLLGNDKLIGLAKDLTPEKFGTTPQKLSDGTEMLILFASGISRLANSIGEFPEEAKQNLIDFFSAVSDIAFASTDGNSNTMMLSEQMISLGIAIGSFSSSIENINSDNIKKANEALIAVANLAQMLDSVGVGILQEIFTGGTSLQEFAGQLSTLGSDLANFMNYMSPINDSQTAIKEWSFNNVASAMYGLNQLVIAASRLDGANVKALQDLLKDGGSIGSNILTFLAGISGATAEIDLKGSNDPFKIKYSDLDIKNISGLLDSFQKICNAFGSLKGINLDNIIKALGGYDWIFGGSEKKGIAAVISQLNKAFISITANMRVLTKNKELGIDLELVNNYSKMVGNFLNALGSAYTYIASDKVFKQGEKGWEVVSVESMMTQMVEAFRVLNENSDALFEMIDTLAEKANDEKLDKANHALEVLKNLGIALSLFGGQTFSDGGTGFMTNYVNDGLNNLQVLSIDNSLLADALNGIFTNLESFISNEQNTESIKSSGKTMASYLFEGMQEAFNTDTSLKLHISAVIDDYSFQNNPSASNFAPSNMSMDYNVGSDIAAYAQMAMSNPYYNFEKDLYNLSYLNSIDEKLGKMEQRFDGNVSGVASALASAKVVVDPSLMSRALGPYIDAYLAEVGQIWLNHASTTQV